MDCNSAISSFLGEVAPNARSVARPVWQPGQRHTLYGTAEFVQYGSRQNLESCDGGGGGSLCHCATESESLPALFRAFTAAVVFSVHSVNSDANTDWGRTDCLVRSEGACAMTMGRKYGAIDAPIAFPPPSLSLSLGLCPSFFYCRRGRADDLPLDRFLFATVRGVLRFGNIA